MLPKLFINNDIKACGLSQHVAISDVDVDFTEAVLMLIFYQQHSHIDYLLVLIIVDHIDTAGLGIIIVDHIDIAGFGIIIVDHIDIAGLGHHVKDFCHTNDYQADISYAAYWIINLLFIFEKEAF